MKANTAIPAPKFVIYANKPKAKRIAEWLRLGCQRKGYDLTIVQVGTAPRPGTIGVFYGVVPETYAAFAYYKAEGRALYLDNGWLSTPELPTLRFAWNGVQPHLAHMPIAETMAHFPALPDIKRKPIPDQALLILQSPYYFENLRLPYTRDGWQRAITHVLNSKGYDVVTREKPATKTDRGPSFFDQIATAGIVVSLNSAACVKALRYGIPAYCTLDCTLSPMAPVKIPDAGRAAIPNYDAVDTFCKRLSSYEMTTEELHTGAAVERFLLVPKQHRTGYWYGP